MKAIVAVWFGAIVIAGVVSLAMVAVLEPALIYAEVDDELNVGLSVTDTVSVTPADDIFMEPNLEFEDSASTGSGTWSVSTNNESGYTLSLSVSSDPALQHVDESFSFDDFSAPGQPTSWDVDNAAEFGFSVFGSDVDEGIWGAGSNCVGVGGDGDIPTDLNYRGFEGTTSLSVAARSSSTPFGGIDTTACFAVEQVEVFAPEGEYQATINATVTTN